MKYTSTNLLESVIHITKERDKQSLVITLLDVLSQLIEAKSLIFLSLPRKSSGERLHVMSAIPLASELSWLSIKQDEYDNSYVEADELITRCLIDKTTVYEQDTSPEKVLFPIIVNSNAVGLLYIIGHNCNSESCNLIGHILRIYSNFMAILDDNEHDPLTGLFNRRTFDAQLAALLSDNIYTNNDTSDERRTNKSAYSHWLGLLDIDFFKSINDNYGHIYGDEVLLLFSDIMKNSFRSHDLLFRYGGEEFVVVLAPAEKEDALAVFERFRKKLENFDFPQVGRVTVSIGVSRITLPHHPATLLEQADKALYYAKEHGRNQVQDYNQLVELGHLKERNIEDDIELF